MLSAIDQKIKMSQIERQQKAAYEVKYANQEKQNINAT